MTLSLRPAALADIRDGALWYNTREDGLGLAFIDEVQQRLDWIQATPKRWAIGFLSLRKVGLGRFPYAIYYKEAEPDDWIVFAVLHHRRDREVLRQRN